MKIGFAIVAWNEAECIGMTIESVAKQSLFSNIPESVELLEFAVVVNGSTDGTADIARECCERFFPKTSKLSVTVHELPEPNRAAAWNAFVHEISNPECDFIGFMDADIKLMSESTLDHLVSSLATSPQAFAAGGNSVKDIAVEGPKTLRQRLSVLGTNLKKKARLPFLPGQLYLCKTSFIRQFYVPYGMCGDDSLFTQLAWTNFGLEKIDSSRVLECEEAPYVFEAYDKVRDVFRQHRRRLIGGVMHRLLFSHAKANRKPGEHAGHVMTREFKANPHWLFDLLESHVNERGIKAMNWHSLMTPITQLKYQPWLKKIVIFPISCLFVCWWAYARVAAYRTVRSGSLRSVWEKPGNQRMKSAA